jgi:hypothetical protein
MDPCYHPKVCNCIHECRCDHNYECCSETPPKGPPQYGLCVKQGTCIPTKGLCKSQSSNRPNIISEHYRVNTIEGYHSDHTKLAFIGLVITISAFFLLY